MRICRFFNFFKRKNRVREIELDLASPEFEQHPYPYYEYLRDHAPVYWSPLHQAWLVSRYEDVAYVLKHAHLFSSSIQAYVDSVLNGADPPAHTRVRKILVQALSKQYFNSLEQVIIETCEELVDAMVARGQGDMVSELARPLPALIVCHMLGVDRQYADDFRLWTGSFFSAKNLRANEDHAKEFSLFTAEYVKQCQQNKTYGVISHLVKSKQTPQPFTDEEAASLIRLLILAGIETTTHLIGNMLFVLLQKADLLSTLQRKYSLIPDFINEVLRYHPPIRLVERVTTQQVKINKTTIPAKAKVIALLASASRDPDYFERPNQFNHQRQTPRQLAFGYGVHYCLGAQLAELEARIVIETLLSRVSGLKPAEPLEQIRFTYPIRGPERLEVFLCEK